MLHRFLFFSVFLILLSSSLILAEEKPKKKKDIRDFNDADLDRLFDEWEANDEDELEEDELPAYKRKNNVQFGGLNGAPEDMIKQAKRGQPVMMFVGIVDPAGNEVTKEFTDRLTKLWQSALYNNHIESQVFIVENNRVVFMVSEGSLAFEARDFLIKQEEVSEVSLEGSTTKGAGQKYLKKDKKEL